MLRIPGWCNKFSIKQNGKLLSAKAVNGFVEILIKANDNIELDVAMPAILLESNPLVEETRNRVTVKRGPIVYCIESADLPNQNVFDVVIPANIKLQPQPMKIAEGNIMALTGQAKILQSSNWSNTLYKEINMNYKSVNIKLIPYYAWANRGKTDMTVWMNLMR
jgi:DUF1680 family protein